jgi:3,4-dihydroxy 2-butanone 4-phosphate synthase/GTP cyclohydrolase II
VDTRDYAVGAQILQDLGVTKMMLMTNNPLKYRGISELGLNIEGRVPLITAPNSEDAFHLKTKEEVLGHILD